MRGATRHTVRSLKCGAGSVQSLPAQKFCAVCEPGQFSATEGRSECLPCPKVWCLALLTGLRERLRRTTALMNVFLVTLVSTTTRHSKPRACSALLDRLSAWEASRRASSGERVVIEPLSVQRCWYVRKPHGHAVV